ncbi:lipid asymmetry maintenance protein MlaB [Abyssibacter sp.]|jgi:ABC-type transporter Mla MlaB component|uniref:STAS domain-containing protein n=1 Tax=Abyssibacter sp. TaxID=2320200 RepID=UPI0035147987
MTTQSVTVDLDGEVSIREIASLHARLMDARNSEQPVTLDGEDVSRVDTPGLQLLAGFVMERARCGRETGWSAASVALLDGARLLGMEAMLALDHLPATAETH